MMADYLRDKYQDQWPLSNKKEQYIADLLEKRLGVKVIAYGAGALSTERFYGKIKNPPGRRSRFKDNRIRDVCRSYRTLSFDRV